MLFDFEDDFSSKEIFYFAQALETISNGNTSIYFDAFSKKKINNEGIEFTKEELLFIFKQVEIQIHTEVVNNIPNKFKIYIKSSPLSNFRKWIFTLSNKNHLKSNSQEGYQKDFFLKNVDSSLYFIDILYNLAHEKMLSYLYDNLTIEHYSQNLLMRIPANGQIIIYRNYLKDKVFKMELILSKNTNLKKFLDSNINIYVVKNATSIKYKISVNNFTERIYVLNLKAGSVTKKSSTTAIKNEFTDDFFRESRENVIKLVMEYDGKNLETNQFGNVSLGRVAKIPILVNLSKKNANIKVDLKFDQEKQNLAIFHNDKKIKAFTIMQTLKSNWLEKEKK